MSENPSAIPRKSGSSDFLVPEEAAARLKVSTSWLAKARMRGEGPPFIKVGRSVRYFPLELWVATQRRSSPKK